MSAARGIRRLSTGRIESFEAGREAGRRSVVIRDVLAVETAFAALVSSRGEADARAILDAVPEDRDPLPALRAALKTGFVDVLAATADADKPDVILHALEVSGGAVATGITSEQIAEARARRAAR